MVECIFGSAMANITKEQPFVDPDHSLFVIVFSKPRVKH